MCACLLWTCMPLYYCWGGKQVSSHSPPLNQEKRKPLNLSVHQVQLPLILFREGRCTWPISIVHSPCSNPISKHGSRNGGEYPTASSLWFSISLSMSFLNLMIFLASVTPIAVGFYSVRYLLYLF